MLRKRILRLHGKFISALFCVHNILFNNKCEIDFTKTLQAIFLFHLLNLLNLNIICKVFPQAQV